MSSARILSATQGAVGQEIQVNTTTTGMKFGVAAAAFYGGNEAALAGWISTYVQAEGFSASAATWVLASHWLGLIVARALLSPRVERVKTTAIVCGAIAGAVCVALFVVFRAPGWLAIAPFAIGFSIALVVPTTLALAGDRYPGNTGALFGFLLTLLQVGGIAIPATIGLVADRAGRPRPRRPAR